jgi:hypothetical protein
MQIDKSVVEENVMYFYWVSGVALRNPVFIGVDKAPIASHADACIETDQ